MAQVQAAVNFQYRPGDCQTHVYQDEKGHWWRYCFTHDDGSNKYGKHLRGHRHERNARMSERDHVLQHRKNRARKAAVQAWAVRLCAAQTWDEFIVVYCERFTDLKPYPAREGSMEAMCTTQEIYRKYATL